MSSPDPAEADRLAVLARYSTATVTGSPAFDRLVRLAADLCGTSMALVTLVEADTHRFLSAYGIAAPPVDRAAGFCGTELAGGEALVVPDARADRRFAEHDIVTGVAGVRFYAGVPLVAPEGQVLGRLSVLDTEPRALTPQQSQQLHTLADEVMAQLTLRRQAAELSTEVTARRASETALADSERLLHAVLANPEVITFACGPDGRCLMANDAMHELVGAPPGSLVGRRCTDVLPPGLFAVCGGGRADAGAADGTADDVTVQRTRTAGR